MKFIRTTKEMIDTIAYPQFIEARMLTDNDIPQLTNYNYKYYPEGRIIVKKEIINIPYWKIIWIRFLQYWRLK